jgi:hypothetical protein
MARTKEHGPPSGPPPPEVPTKTGGGGDDDDNSLREAIAQMAAQAVEQAAGSRKEFVTSERFVLVPETLVGSWFHRLENGEIIWQGVVVAEPQPGAYLVQIDRQEPGVENVQRLIGLESMLADDDGYDWRFYDTEEQAQNAFARSLSTRKE